MKKFILLTSLPVLLIGVECNLKKKPHFMKHINDITNYVDNEIKNFGRKSLFFQNDFKQPIQTRLSLPSETVLRTREDMNKTVTFRLYTPEVKEKYEILKVNDSASLAKSHFNSKRPTRFITHGYLASADGPSCTLIRDAYLNNSNCNVIVIDWRLISQGSYVRARLHVETIGNHIGAMINFLEEKGMDPNTTTLVGHSLGAHIMGLAGQNATHKINYTIGLDPALPLFALVGPDERISPGDANLVEIIHTDAGLLGDPKVLGNFDFYPNGGALQPGCSDNLSGSACSHSRSYEYFAESLKNSTIPFYSLKCGSYEAFKSNKCENYDTVMGGINYVPKRNGTYYLNTNSSPPYSLGMSYGNRKSECSSGIIAFFQKIVNFFIGSGYVCYK